MERARFCKRDPVRQRPRPGQRHEGPERRGRRNDHPCGLTGAPSSRPPGSHSSSLTGCGDKRRGGRTSSTSGQPPASSSVVPALLAAYEQRATGRLRFAASYASSGNDPGPGRSPALHWHGVLLASEHHVDVAPVERGRVEAGAAVTVARNRPRPRRRAQIASARSIANPARAPAGGCAHRHRRTRVRSRRSLRQANSSEQPRALGRPLQDATRACP